MISQEWDVLEAFAQRRDFNLDGINAIQEVLPETVLLYHFIERHIGGANKADVDWRIFVDPTRLTFRF